MSKIDMTSIFEAMSAMQKAIRRNEMETAYFFALKIEEFNPIMLWNRLQVIVCEDIGNANPSLPTTFETLRTWYYREMDKGKEGVLILAHVISLMATGPKSRDSDNLCSYVYNKQYFEGDYMEIPDYAHDAHTLKGKKMGRGREWFWTESVKLAEDESDKELLAKMREFIKIHPKEPQLFPQKERVKKAWQGLRKNRVKKPEPVQTFLDDTIYSDSDNDREADTE